MGKSVVEETVITKNYSAIVDSSLEITYSDQLCPVMLIERLEEDNFIEFVTIQNIVEDAVTTFW